ncbi:MAG: hypothetical protein R2784_13335 [Saprospiraceae bacterium]
MKDSETSAAIQTHFENDLQWDKYLTIGRKWFSSKEFKSASLTQKAINVLMKTLQMLWIF